MMAATGFAEPGSGRTGACGSLRPPHGDKLRQMSTQELQQLLEDDAKLESMVRDMEELENIQMEKELCLASNRSLAEENLKQQPQLEEGRLLLAQKYQQLKTLHEAFTEKAARIESRADSQGVDTLLALLQAEGAKIEDETEKMAEHFMEGQLTLEEFVDDYQNKRRLAHMRRIKIEKLQEIIAKQQQQQPQANQQQQQLQHIQQLQHMQQQQQRHHAECALPARPAPLPPMPGRTSSPVHPQPGPQNSAPNSMHYPYFQGASMPAQALDPNRALPPLQHRGQGPSMPAPFSYQGPGYGAPQQPGGWGPILHRAPNPPPRPGQWNIGSQPPPLPPRSGPAQIGFVMPQ
ncbi:vacuolar protein sorting-associated protein 37B-like [Lethenteron reissneri]|uniref:vacuolar protein sorting-associated protein 37B-like n=1 Tax=Lethenteron reissneri TaxID=7753 RepID=UPI002AB65467|nr:vacuolar protein sorting-associated protein 37B-like [Lethenteron reissneri]XP_061407687.1 vacuolar protein sorting-associated protein 37B-like [Lethenteron reissneri]